MSKINLEFTVDEVTAILNIVAELPYAKAVGLINSIQAQAAPQVAAAQKAEDKAE